MMKGDMLMDEYGRRNEITSRDYVKVLFRHKGVIFTTVATVMATVVAGLLLNTQVYEAQVKMLISGQKRAQADYYTDIGFGGGASMRLTMTQSEIVNSDPVIERAVKVLRLAQRPLDYEMKFCSRLKKPLVEYRVRNIERKLGNAPEEQKTALLFRLAMENLRQSVDVEPVRETDMFLIKVKDFNPLGAAVTANVVSRSYVIFDLEQQLAEMKLKYGEKNLAVTQLKEAIEKMSRGLNGAPLAPIDAIGPATVKIIEQAKVPLKPAGIPRALTVTLGFFVSVFLSLIMAFTFEYMDQTFRSPQEAESLLGIKYLGSLRKKAKRKDYYELSEQFYLDMKERGVKSFVLTSAQSREGVSTIIANLGTAIANHLNRKVLIIDGNLRNPAVHTMFKLPESKDLFRVVDGTFTPDKALKVISPNLHLLTSGTSDANRIEILESHRMKRLIRQAKERYDFVLVDSAPFGRVHDAVMLADCVEGIVVVINESRTRRQVVKKALESLQQRGVPIIGMILNNRKYVIPRFIYNRV